ncbi:hypothetical protein J9H63_000160 [Salmonella enterica]|nr:hypothetical protein [Salmonella enterica]
MSLGGVGSIFKLAFQTSPILLQGGIAEKIPGGIIPIALFTEGLSIVNGLLHGKLNGATAAFTPMPGTTLIQQDICNLNFYNQITAANSVVKKPNRVVMQMVRPVSTEDGGYITKGITFAALKIFLEMHNDKGGRYIVLTPSYIYTDCLMRSFIDVSGLSEQNKQVQHTWQIEFEQPLITTSSVTQTLNNIMSKFEKGTQGKATWKANGDLIPPIPKF